MYRIGALGDCFLLTFQNNTTVRNVLIDCGSFQNSNVAKARLKQIVNDIKTKQLKGAKLNVVVGTHQHNDHVNGFVHEEATFKTMGVEQVWLSWLDNPRNKQATKIGQSHLELRKSLKTISQKLGAMSNLKGASASSPFAMKARTTKLLLDDMLGFFGAAPETPAKGIEILKKIGDNDVDYLFPGKIVTIPGIPASEVRVFVLGPPKDEALLYRKNPRKGESYDEKLQALNGMAMHFMAALNNKGKHVDKEEQQFPFNQEYKRFLKKSTTYSHDMKEIAKLYADKSYTWRTIDDDWLEQASRLALYMDTFTNNSSIAMAIELVKSGKVLLFAADAQTGNWLSWENVKFKDDKSITIDNLLDRTVLYKVGHHGSHNSTLKNAFEKMNSEELVVMIPVEKTDPHISKQGWKMPAENLFKRLNEKTHNRVLRMDDGYAAGSNPATNAKAKASWANVTKPTITPLYIEYTIS